MSDLTGVYPVCPHCGELCGRLARICADCGALLVEDMRGERNHRRDFGQEFARRMSGGIFSPNIAAPPPDKEKGHSP